MKKDGKFCGSAPSYGYMRDPLDKHKLVPDPETAPVVKKIFDLYVAGYGSSQIAEILTREELPTDIERNISVVLVADKFLDLLTEKLLLSSVNVLVLDLFAHLGRQGHRLTTDL